MKILALVLLAAALVSAQPQLKPPQIGFLADKNNSLRPVYGFGGNLLLGDSLGENVLSAASSHNFVMAKTSSQVVVLDGNGQGAAACDAPDGPALFAFTSDGQPALAWVAASGTLLLLKHDHCDSLNVSVLNGSAIAVAQDGSDWVRFVVSREDGLWQVSVALIDGSLQSQAALPGIAEPVLLTPGGGMLYTNGTLLVIRAADGSERSVDTGATIGGMAALERDWVRLIEQGTNRQFAVRLTPGREQVWQLPEEASCCAQ